jgi:parallel beta-helix repeat protein
MNLTHVHVGHLGFGQGTASGVAWAGTGYEPARGTVTRSAFRKNRYGAYTFHAADMAWTGNVFEDNQVHGLAVHDFSAGFAIRDNTARRNGRHGFAISRGCHDNLLEGNRSEGNLGDGFALEDAPLAGVRTSKAAIISTGTVLRSNTAVSNGGAGADVHGGKGTTLSGNALTGNRLGVRFAATASGTVEGNQVHRNTVAGIHVEAGAGTVILRGNHASGSWADLLVARDVEQSGNVFGVERVRLPAPPRPFPQVALTWARDGVASHPAIAVWLVVLCVPLLARAAVRL